jgi:surfeit locus 1 family protein
MTLTLSLGMWQLRRAAEKQAFVAAIEAAKAAAPLQNSDVGLLEQPESMLHRRVQLQGRWLVQHTVYLDNRQMNAKVGFYVFTPFQVKGTSTIVMVQRGWAPRNFLDRAQLPVIETPAEESRVEGRIALPPSKLYEFTGAGGGPIRQNLDLAQYRQETGVQVVSGWTVVQVGAASEGLLRDWPVVNAGVQKHHGYAAQWFALTALIAVLFIWFQLRRPSKPKEL